MKKQRLVYGLLSALLLIACSEPAEEKLEPLSRIDFRPNSEFGFDALLLGLKLGKEAIDKRAPEDGTERAEGYRFLFRLIEMNLNTLSGDHDPAHPQISRCPSKNCKLGYDNPDYTYVGALPLSADHNYRLYGDRGTAQIMLFQVLERGDGAFKGTSKTHSEKMRLNADGSWEIFLGAEKPADVADENFLRLKEENAQLVIRIGHYDWNKSIEPSVNIEHLGTTPAAEAFTPMRMAVTGFAMSKMIPGQVQRWIDIINNAPLNDVSKPCRGWATGCGEGGFGGYATGGHYKLEDDQVLLIEAPHTQSVYQNIQLANIWGESQDYANKQTSLNGFQAKRDSDGIYRYVLAHKDPGVANWLDISDHPEGSVYMRWVLTDEVTPNKPKVTVLDADELLEHLPQDTPRVNAGEREQILKNRLAGYNRRTNPANLHQ